MNKQRLINEILNRWRDPYTSQVGGMMTRERALDVEDFIAKSVDLTYEAGHDDGYAIGFDEGLKKSLKNNHNSMVTGYNKGLEDGHKGREKDMEASVGFPHP